MVSFSFSASVSIAGVDGECIVKSKGDGDVEIKNIICPTNIKEYVIRTEEDFIIKEV